MPSSTEIVNLALDQIGVDPISALDDGTVKSEKCKRLYDIILPTVLEARAWRFADTRLSIAKDEDDPTSTVLLYQYTMPADCIRPLLVNEDDGVIWARERRKILTSEESPIVLKYTGLITDPNIWTPTFTLSFATLFGSYGAAGRFKKDPKESEMLFERYVAMIADAGTLDSQQASVQAARVTTLTSVRTG